MGRGFTTLPSDLLILALSINSQPCAQICLGTGSPRGHQERGPDDRVEADDFLANQMQVGGPETAAFVFRATYSAEVSGEGVEPDVEDVRLFAGNRNAPADRRCA